MHRTKAFVMAISLAMLTVGFLPSARADEWNKKTVITVNEPLAIPGKVLAPGKYVMKLLDSPGERHVVQVFNADESQIQATILAIPNYRMEPTGKTQFSFWEMPTGQPRALRAWFYPGDNFGQEFAYPKDLATTIANANSQNVPTVTGEGNNAQVTQTTPSEPTQTAEAQPQQPAPAPTPAPAPEQNENNNATAQNNTAPAPSPAPVEQPSMAANNPPARSLPQTASPFPLAGLGGILAMGGALAARILRKRSA